LYISFCRRWSLPVGGFFFSGPGQSVLTYLHGKTTGKAITFPGDPAA
jgi:hypothetical protein